MPESQQDTSKRVDVPSNSELLTRRPYPPAHFTRPAIAARALVDGIFSTAYAKDRGEILIENSRWQSERAISVTDLEGIIKEEGIVNPQQLAAGVYGIGEGEQGDTYQRGGVCLLLNPNIRRYYGGDFDTTDVKDANRTMLSNAYATQAEGKVKYGGGYRGEAVVEDVVRVSDIQGVILSNTFEDSDIFNQFKDKIAALSTDSPQDLLRIFNDEITLLRALKSIPVDLNDAMQAFQSRYIEAKKLANTNDPSGIYKLADVEHLPEDADEDQKTLRAEYYEKAQVLEGILGSDAYKGNLDKIRNALSSLVPGALEALGVETYGDLVLHFAAKAQIPVYGASGQVLE